VAIGLQGIWVIIMYILITAFYFVELKRYWSIIAEVGSRTRMAFVYKMYYQYTIRYTYYSSYNVFFFSSLPEIRNKSSDTLLLQSYMYGYTTFVNLFFLNFHTVAHKLLKNNKIIPIQNKVCLI
jgi:hypothetical protein